MMPDAAVLPQTFAMVRGHDDPGVLCLLVLQEEVEQAPEVPVEVGDRVVIGGAEGRELVRPRRPSPFEEGRPLGREAEPAGPPPTGAASWRGRPGSSGRRNRAGRADAAARSTTAPGP